MSLSIIERAHQPAQAGFVDHLDAQLLRSRELRPRRVARDDVIGLPRDRTRHLAAGALDARARLLAGQVRQGAGEDESLLLEGPALRSALGLVELETKAALAQALDQLADGRLGELVNELVREHRADPLDLLDLLRARRE